MFVYVAKLIQINKIIKTKQMFSLRLNNYK